MHRLFKSTPSLSFLSSSSTFSSSFISPNKSCFFFPYTEYIFSIYGCGGIGVWVKFSDDVDVKKSFGSAASDDSTHS